MTNDDEEGFKLKELQDIPWSEINKTIEKISEFVEKLGGAWGKHAVPLRAEELKAARHSTYLAYGVVFIVVGVGAILAWEKSISSEAIVGLLGAVIGYIFGRK